jgi:ribosome recycling factor
VIILAEEEGHTKKEKKRKEKTNMLAWTVLRRLKSNLSSLTASIPSGEAYKSRMDAAIAHLQTELGSFRTRATPQLLDSVRVTTDDHPQGISLKQIASISVKQPGTLQVAPFDPRNVPHIETAIRNAQLGLNPTTSGGKTAPAAAIQVPIPKMTGEQRDKMLKECAKAAEHARVSIRNIRKDALQHIEKMVSDGKEGKAGGKDGNKKGEKEKAGLAAAAQQVISKDDYKRIEKAVQSLTDEIIQQVDKMAKDKEKDLKEA